MGDGCRAFLLELSHIGLATYVLQSKISTITQPFQDHQPFEIPTAGPPTDHESASSLPLRPYLCEGEVLVPDDVEHDALARAGLRRQYKQTKIYIYAEKNKIVSGGFTGQNETRPM